MRLVSFVISLLALACATAEPPAPARAIARPARAPSTVLREEAAPDDDVRRVDPSAAPADPCEGRTGASCHSEGSRLVHGYEVAADAARGFAMMARACELGYGTACYDLAQIRSVGNEHVPRDLDEYVRLVQLACERGSPDGCNDLRRPVRELRRECAQGFAGQCALADHLERVRPDLAR